MNTTEFTKMYGSTLDTLMSQCLYIDNGATCCDGIKCDVHVDGFKDMDDFVKHNSAFFIEDLAYVLESMPKRFNPTELKLRLCVENYEDGEKTWEGEAIYADCWHIPYCNDRNSVFGKDVEVCDGFIVFDKVRISNFKVVEKPTECECECECGKCECKHDSAKGDFLKELIKEFNEAKCEDGSKSFSKSFSYSIDGDGNVKASKTINGDKKEYEFNIDGEDPVEKLNNLAD